MLDKTGPIENPKSLRERLRLSPDHAVGTVEEQGVAVFYSGQPLTASASTDMLTRIREERDWANLGRHE